ncbi:hypothetical protein F4604DRAFT_1593674 [Suillus subluteus]|nr:hypothetical protein F4604DRAFT_1593647 [Suillus subluteus]KAG1849022.1 hypothetical protein F4604DRAFT_1593674 [Suillus subluteus]
MFFYGPSGAGNKIQISCTLRQLFGSGVENLHYLTCSARLPGVTNSKYKPLFFPKYS